MQDKVDKMNLSAYKRKSTQADYRLGPNVKEDLKKTIQKWRDAGRSRVGITCHCSQPVGKHVKEYLDRYYPDVLYLIKEENWSWSDWSNFFNTVYEKKAVP